MSLTSARTRRAAVIGVLSAAVLASGATAAPAQIRQYDPMARYVVDSTGDESDAWAGNGVCATAAKRCTLRAALQEAANDNATSEIGFALKAGVTHVIRPPSALPALRDFAGPTRIDGRNLNDGRWIELEGPGVESTVDGLTITSTGNSVSYLAIYNFRNQIRITGWNNRVTRTVLGTNGAGKFRPPVKAPLDDRAGLLLEGDAANNEIGELYRSPATATVIAGNASPGILIRGSASANRVRGALIGLSPGSVAALPNRGHGVVFGPSTRFNLLDDGNYIAANEGNGVVVGGTLNDVGRNVLGMRPSRWEEEPSADMIMANGAANVAVGPSTHARVRENLMAGSAGGVRIGDSGINGARVIANDIGYFGRPLSDPNVASAIGVEVLDGSNVAVAYNHLAYQHIGLALRVPVHQEGNAFERNWRNVVSP